MTILTTTNTIDHERCIKKITGTLSEIKPELAKPILEQLISEFYLQEVDPVTVESIIEPVCKELGQSQDYQYDISWLDLNQYIDQIYKENIRPNMGLDGTQYELTNAYDVAEATSYYNNLKKALRPYSKTQLYQYSVGTNRMVVLNQKTQTVDYVTSDAKGNLYNEIVINAYPQTIIIHDSPLDDIGRTFSISWVSKTSHRIFETKRQTIKEIETYLEEAGWVITPRRLKGCLAAVIQISIQYKLSTVKNEIDNPGIYYDKSTEQLKLINYEYHEPTHEELNSAIDILELLSKFFKGHETKLATSIKWGLMSFFDYAIKQIGGDWIPWLYMYGKAGSGKTTLGKINLYLWDKPNEDNDIGGSNFDTVARVGARVSQSTLPILVSEPEGALSKVSIQGMLKSTIENTTARGRYQGKTYKNVPAFACGMLTANQALDSGDALYRRFLVMLFSHSEKKGKEDKELFDKTFKIKSPKFSSLNRLKGLSNFFLSEIIHQPELLQMKDWQTISDELLTLAYLDVGREIPNWLLSWHETESLDDLDDEEREEIRLFFINQINLATRKVEVWDVESNRRRGESLVEEFKTSDDFDDRVWHVLNEQLIPWMGLHRPRNGSGVNVYCTSGIKRPLKDVTHQSYALPSIAELLEWDYQALKVNSKSIRVMMCSYNDFLSFLFPKMVDDVNRKGEQNFKEVTL